MKINIMNYNSKDLKKYFDKFFQISNSSWNKAAKVGLNKRVIKVLGGSVFVKLKTLLLV